MFELYERADYLAPYRSSDQPTHHQVFVLRVLTTVSCSMALIACLSMFYVYFAMHHRSLKLRHRLITFLIFFDLMRAIAIILYPILAFCKHDIDDNRYAVNFLGFFTAMSFEGGDLAILSFALYSLITIYYPNDGKRWLSSKRYFIYIASFIIPLVLAVLPFVGEGYISTQVYCYLPYSPLWYRMALSWGPRYFIMVAISIIYFLIYYYVRSQLKKLEHEVSFKVMDVSGTTGQPDADSVNGSYPIHANWFEKLSNKVLKIEPEQDQETVNQTVSSVTNTEERETEVPVETLFSLNHFDINRQLQINNQIRLKNRYKLISRQMAEIFLYPTAYFLIWIFPMIAQSLTMEVNKKSYAISVLTALSVPFCGLVDTLVFFYRERPWQFTYEYYDQCHKHDRLNYHDLVIPNWRIALRKLPLYHIPEEYFKVKTAQESQKELNTMKVYCSRMLKGKDTSRITESYVPGFSSSGLVSDIGEHESEQGLDLGLSRIEDEYYDEEIDFMDILRNGPGGHNDSS
ncbi:hypothetical protein WICPIJ_003194 [Wickerhamomyces pijperi]|uniref:G-protein coupled receptors family 1 profile domain-containing protein n=1 Tax=Wickerhamomyces pijperi TaxID=599730 RepID=A0A9P8TP39_WICPI|nr:hypothetical protein WICPIJ_003194 [Wickerhamomyces pijperi]